MLRDFLSNNTPGYIHSRDFLCDPIRSDICRRLKLRGENHLQCANRGKTPLISLNDRASRRVRGKLESEWANGHSYARKKFSRRSARNVKSNWTKEMEEIQQKDERIFVKMERTARETWQLLKHPSSVRAILWSRDRISSWSATGGYFIIYPRSRHLFVHVKTREKNKNQIAMSSLCEWMEFRVALKLRRQHFCVPELFHVLCKHFYVLREISADLSSAVVA